MPKLCAWISTALHVVTLLLTIRAMRPAPEVKPQIKYVPVPQESIFNSYDTHNS